MEATRYLSNVRVVADFDRISIRARNVPRPFLRRTRRASVRLAHEDKRRAGHNRGAGADERHIGVLDLARARAVRCLQSAFYDVPQAMDTSGSEAAAKGVERQCAVQFDAAVLDEIERLSFPAKAVGFEAVDHRGRKAVI